jgi:protein O-mannosyl-transferase
LYLAITWLIADLSVSLRYPRDAGGSAAPSGDAKYRRRRRTILGAAGLLVIAALSECAWKQTSYWKNGETLWTHTLAVTTPDNDVAHTNFGMLLAERGQLDEALSHLQTALQIRSSSTHAHYALSLALIHSDLGFALARKGSLDDAISHLRNAIQFQPDYADAHYNLGSALFQKGQLDEAIAQWRTTLSIRPDDAGAHTSLGNALVQKGSLRDAIAHYEAALEFSPHSILALNNLAWVLSTCPEAALRNGAKAVALAEKADQYSDRQNPIFTRTLAAAYAEAGRFNDAFETARRASQLARAQGEPQLADEIAKDVDLYREKSPLRDASLANSSR